jgi:hypothetical protein
MTKMVGLKTRASETSAVLRVGEGRGFVVEYRHHLGHKGCVIITAAHCLPRLPRPHPASYLEERTYLKLLGPLGNVRKRKVWAECMFADPVADIAVLGQPDDQELSDEADAYDRLVDGMAPLVLADAPAQGFELRTVERPTIGDVPAETFTVKRPTPGEGPARVLSLDGRWRDVRVQRRGNVVSVEPRELVVSGMSGSPIISPAGEAIGLISVDRLCPVLVDSLSAWWVRAIKEAARLPAPASAPATKCARRARRSRRPGA